MSKLSLSQLTQHLFGAIDTLRGTINVSASKNIIFGLLLLKHCSDEFEMMHGQLRENYTVPDSTQMESINIVEGPQKYIGTYFVPSLARWELIEQAPINEMGNTLNRAMQVLVEANTPSLGMLDIDFNEHNTISNQKLRELVAYFGRVRLCKENFEFPDMLSMAFENLLHWFADAEGQRSGEFYTPQSIRQLIVEILEPLKGRIFDPACGSGGMFIQSLRFIHDRQLSIDNISFWGQEIAKETTHLCRMNLAINGVSGEITHVNSYYSKLHELWGQFDFVMSNPPFNVNIIDKARLIEENQRYPFGLPRTDNANYLWIQMFYSALNQHGRAGFVMPNSASDARSSELEIRRQLLQEKALDVIISISSNFFYTVTLPCTVWFLDKGKVGTQFEDTVLFIDARNIYQQIDRRHRGFTPEDIEFITNIVRLYRGKAIETTQGSQTRIQETFLEGKYMDIANLCRVATSEEIEAQEWSLNPSRYVGTLIPPKGYEQVKLQEIAEIQRGFTPRTKDWTDKAALKQEISGDVVTYFVKARNIQNDGSIDIESLEMLGPSDNIISTSPTIEGRYFLRPNDILVAILGNTHHIPIAIVSHELPKRVIFAQTLIRIRVTTDLADPQSVFTFLQSETGQLMLHSYAASGTGVPQISVSALNQISVFLPSPSHEKKVDREELSSLSQVLNQLKNDIVPSLELLEQIGNDDPEKSQQQEEIARKLKELTTILSPLSLTDKIIHNYPMPIALSYRRFLEARFNVYEQVLRLRDVFEAASFFVYHVVLADTLRRLDPKQYYVENKDHRKAYNSDSMAHRIDFAKAIIDIAKLNSGKDLFIREIIQYPSIVTLAEKLKDFRNQISHTAATSESLQRKILHTYQPVVEEMLAQLEFLSSYLLVRIPSFHYEKDKLICVKEIYQGVMLTVRQDDIDSSNLPNVDHNHIALMDVDNQILDLHPLYQLIANDNTHDEIHLCFLKRRKKDKEYLEGESVQGAFGIDLEGFDDFESLINKRTEGQQ